MATSDGKRFLVQKPAISVFDDRPVVVVEGWRAEVERLGSRCGLAPSAGFVWANQQRVRTAAGKTAVGRAFGLPAPTRDAEHDVMEALARWFENGVPPDRIVASRYDENGAVVAQRPWCPYPAIPVWDGRGDRNGPDSYSCETR